MDPHLERLQQQILTALELANAQQTPSPGKWSTAEILEHLYLTYTGTIKGFERVLAEGKPLATKPTLQKRLRALVVVGFGYLPSGRESPAVARPRGIPSEKVISEVAGKIAEMDAMMCRCDEKFGSGTPLLDHPVLGPLSTGQWRKFHLIHGLHHVKQIHRLQQTGRT